MVKDKVLQSICAIILNTRVSDPLCKKFADVISEINSIELIYDSKFSDNFLAGIISPEENIRSYFPSNTKVDTWKIIETAKEIRGRVFIDYKNS